MIEVQPGLYRTGTAGQSPVVLLHSSQSNGGQWRALLNALAPHFDFLVVDLLGYGKAPAVTTADPQRFRFRDELPRIMDAIQTLNWQQPVTLIGHSYGGALALKLAVEKPIDVRSLVVFEPVAFHLLEANEAARLEIESISGQMMNKDATAATAAFVDYWNQPGYFAALPDKIQKAMTLQASKVQCDFAALMGEEYDLRDCASIQQPTLLLQGQYTQNSARTVAHKLEVALPAVISRTLPCGHMGPITHAEAVNVEILEFLAAIYGLEAQPPTATDVRG